MSNLKNGENKIIAGIEQEALAEVEKILKDAQKQAEEKKKYSEMQVKSILKEAEERARLQADAVRKKILSGVQLEVKRSVMRVRDRVLGEVLDKVKGEFKKMINTPVYRNALLTWMVEGGVGLDSPSVIVKVSQEEIPIIDNKFLKEAEENVKKITGKDVIFKFSDSDPLSLQGVLLYTEDGRVVFNNQVQTRILRKQREIRKLVYESLFHDETFSE